MPSDDLIPITVALRRDQLADLRERAEYYGLSSAELIRAAVDLWLMEERIAVARRKAREAESQD